MRGPLTAALAAVLLGAAPRPSTPTVYSAPAGSRAAGASRSLPTDAILPDGRIAAPRGQATFVGTNPLGVAVSADGRWAIVSNDEQDDSSPSALPASAGAIVPGYSLAVVDTRTMRVASVYRRYGETFFGGIAAVPDPSAVGRTLVVASGGADNLLHVFALENDGTLTETQRIPVAGFPSALNVASNARTAYVTGNLSDTVTSVDLAARRVMQSRTVGFFPNGVAVAGGRAYVSNAGLARYAPASPPRSEPSFAAPQIQSDEASSLSSLGLDVAGGFSGSGDDVVRMDAVPDGVTIVGGARPGAIAARRDGTFAYVAMENVDRIATVATSAQPHVVAGLDLRLFVNAPYGTQPSAEVLSRDGKRLYVALAGLNAVAVLDARNPRQLHRLGLIPTGWYPTALALSPDGRYLYIADARGVDGWGMLQRIDMKRLSLMKATLSALRYNRDVGTAKNNATVPPLRSHRRSTTIDRVVYISVGTASFDALFGPSASRTGTPNLHALAQAYGLADNFYANDMNVDANLQYGLGAASTLYAQRTLHVNVGRSPLDAHGQDPEDYARAGYLFNELARDGMSFRDYGGLLNLSGYQPSNASQDRSRRDRPPQPPLGGLYTLDVPALAALSGHVDLAYPGSNPEISNAARAREFIKDMGALVADDAQPAFTYVWIPVAATSAGLPEADRALGSIVDFLSHTPHWSSTAIFIVGDGVANSTDRVNRARSYAIVVSPLAKAGYVGHAHLSVASVCKTEEELLGLQPLALGDLLSTDMADFLSAVPYPRPYHATP
ncbi:MAG: bifunctional YncE family protein/alkaline phosphatase family protein [Candidatus Eremiobacteraeota bacterium]|nr:bifunctional YncE family protein/alkaline phosphatase family protein [Candidatus Eremiobacteraeota bacterium]